MCNHDNINFTIWVALLREATNEVLTLHAVIPRCKMQPIKIFCLRKCNNKHKSKAITKQGNMYEEANIVITTSLPSN